MTDRFNTGAPSSRMQSDCPPPQVRAGAGLRVIQVAAVAMIDAERRVLVAQRPQGKAMAGLWEFPGGKIEPGELPEAALVRELREELGIDTSIACLAPLTFASHSYTDFHLLMFVYACRKWAGFLQAREGQNLKWCRVPELYRLDMPPADVPVLGILDAII